MNNIKFTYKQYSVHDFGVPEQHACRSIFIMNKWSSLTNRQCHNKMDINCFDKYLKVVVTDDTIEYSNNTGA